MLQRLSELRKERKWSLQDTADQLGIAKSTYAGYESGYRLPSLQSLSQMADLFETSVDYLIGKTNDLRKGLGNIEISEQINNPDPLLYLDGMPLSVDEMLDFVAFVRAKRKLQSNEEKE